MNILIADDDPMQRELLAGFLVKQGYAVVAAEDGEEALTLLLDVADDVAEVVEALDAGPLPIAIIGSSPAMRESLSLARRVADSP
ncbi:hypothetical protein [Thiocystis violacea]|uniref:hypothetical protein n=1 Tax=Thiocystis violacea TaxID=13725 RepID=UPI001F5BB268|nr:hypothetical protein [Thiocystis violacea]